MTFQRRAKQQLAQVVGKGVYRSVIGFCLGFGGYLSLDGRPGEAFIAVGYGLLMKSCTSGAA